MNLTNGKKLDTYKSSTDITQVLDKLQSLDVKLENVSKQLEDEKRARCALQVIVKKYLQINSKDFEDDWQNLKFLANST